MQQIKCVNFPVKKSSAEYWCQFLIVPASCNWHQNDAVISCDVYCVLHLLHSMVGWFIIFDIILQFSITFSELLYRSETMRAMIVWPTHAHPRVKGLEPGGGYTTESVRHRWCDAISGYVRSWHQLLLLGTGSMCVCVCAHACYLSRVLSRPGVEPVTSQSQVQHPYH